MTPGRAIPGVGLKPGWKQGNQPTSQPFPYHGGGGGSGMMVGGGGGGGRLVQVEVVVGSRLLRGQSDEELIRGGRRTAKLDAEGAVLFLLILERRLGADLRMV